MNTLREEYESFVEKNYQNLRTFSEWLVVMEEMVAFLFPKAMLGEHDVWPMLYGCAGGMEYDGCGLLDVDNSDDEVITPWPRKTKIDFCQSSSERLPVWKLSFVNKKVHFQKFELILTIQVIPESIICRLKILLKDNSNEMLLARYPRRLAHWVLFRI